MKCWGMYWGGNNYASPYVRDDTEAFKSLKEAREVFLDRTFYDLRYPCTGENATMIIWFRDPREERDPYADRVIEIKNWNRRTSRVSLA